MSRVSPAPLSEESGRFADSSPPIIIGGCHRSGTSLVRRLLNCHPRIYCGPEVKFFRDFHGDYIQDPLRPMRFMTSAQTMLSKEALFEVLGSAFVEMHRRAANEAGKPRWADKAPENVVYLDEWGRLLGERWIFVHVVRNPLDTLAAINEIPLVLVPAELGARIDFYLDYARAGLRFQQENPDRYVRVVYEDLVTSPEATIRMLMMRLGESFDPGQLAFNSTFHQRGLEDPKVAHSPEIHDRSLGRWRDDLESDEADLITSRTMEVWSALDPEGDWPLPPLC